MRKDPLTIRIDRHWLRLGAVVVLLAALTISSVAWASHRFNDVPDSNVFHDDITWLHVNGVTLGCNPPLNSLYCPDDPVTREQMSAFMRRLAENQVVDAATAIESESAANADNSELLGNQPPEDFVQDLQWVETSATSRIAPGNEVVFSVTCPTGSAVISGGARENGDGYVLTDTQPAADRSGWQVEYRNNTENEQNAPVTVYALCGAYNDKSASAAFDAAEADPNR
ncbi:MAG: hypothetical protein GEU79_11995 [Acidimicrobiia bacterium]|nr:hypothetical protein [Acidimicrobiia bacterium]